jgi:hypothetical protein
MSRPFSSAHAAAKAYAGNRPVADWLRYTDKLIRRGVVIPAPPSRTALKKGGGAVRAEVWRGHRWTLNREA